MPRPHASGDVLCSLDTYRVSAQHQGVWSGCHQSTSHDRWHTPHGRPLFSMHHRRIAKVRIFLSFQLTTATRTEFSVTCVNKRCTIFREPARSTISSVNLTDFNASSDARRAQHNARSTSSGIFWERGFARFVCRPEVDELTKGGVCRGRVDEACNAVIEPGTLRSGANLLRIGSSREVLGASRNPWTPGARPGFWVERAVVTNAW